MIEKSTPTEQSLTDGVIVLRDWQEDDAGWYAAAILDPEIQRFTSEPERLTGAEVRTAIVALRERSDATGFVICDATTGERLGNIGIVRDGSVGEAAYWLASTARGRGLATRALTLISTWAFEELDLTELHLWTHADNLPSRRVAERAGYRRAPDRDDHRTVKGDRWQTRTYVLRAETSGDRSGPPHTGGN